MFKLLQKNVSPRCLSILTFGLALLCALPFTASAGQRQPDLPNPSTGTSLGVRYQAWYNGPGTGVVPNVPTAANPTIVPNVAGALGKDPTQYFTDNVQQQPFITVTAASPSPPRAPSGQNFVIQWDAMFLATIAGTYTFNTTSDDGSLIVIGAGTTDQRVVVDNNQSNGTPTLRSGQVDLAVGYHRISIFFGQGGGGFSMAAQVQPPGGSLTNIDGSLYLRPSPNVSIAPGSSVQSAAVNVTFTIVGTAVPGQQVFYTLDGTAPDAGSAAYNPPLQVFPPAQVRAVVIAPNYDPGKIASADYTLPASAGPTFSPPPPGNFLGSMDVTMTSATTNTFIYYTTDGTNPTINSYGGVLPSPATITITDNTTIKAIAYKLGTSASPVSTATYKRADSSPAVASCLASGVNTLVDVVFSTTVETATANTNSNYTIDNGIQLATTNFGIPNNGTGALLEDDGTKTPNGNTLQTGDKKTVRLSINPATPLQTGVTYTLKVSNVKDRTTGVAIPAAGITYQFQYFNGGGLYYERWEGVIGSNVADLLTSTPQLFPNFPTAGNILPTFEEATISIQNYGSRVAGYFIAPATGLYQFAVAADDSATLSISSDDNPVRKSFITAKVLSTNPTNPREWNKVAGQKSAQVTLQQGGRYYIETLHKQGVSLDNVAATYVFPPDTIQDFVTLPMDSTFQGNVQLTPIIEALRIINHPVGRFVNANQNVTLTFELSGSAPRVYQWFLNGAPLTDGNNVSGATTAMLSLTPFTAAFEGIYTCSCSNPITTTPLVSNGAKLTLINTAPATVTSVTPQFGPITGGTALNITGTNFIEGMGVTLNGKVCSNILVVSATQITCVTPPNPRGSYPVVVTKPGGLGVNFNTNGGFTYDDQPVSNQPGPLTTNEDTVLNFNLTATDASDPVTSFTITAQPKKGTLTFGTLTNSASAPFTGTLPATYTPLPNQNNNTTPNGSAIGPDSFTFVASDGLLPATPVTVIINITPVNDPPTINPIGNLQVNEDTPVTVQLSGIARSGGLDEAGQTVSVSAAITAGNPTTFNSQDGLNSNTLTVSPVVNGNATLTFTGALPGAVTVTVTATDTGPNAPAPSSNNTSVQFTVVVVSVNDPPVIGNPGPKTGTADVSGTILVTGIAPAPPNNIDENAQASIMTLKVTASDPTYFTSLTASPISNGQSTISYVPAYARNGPVTIFIEADDHQTANNLTTINFTLTLAPVNHAPVAKDDIYFPTTNKVFNVPPKGVFANDVEVDNDTLTALLGNTVTNGVLVLNNDGSFTYTPNPGFAGTDSFTYKANDGTVDSNTATVTLTIGSNGQPIATDMNITTPEDTVVNGFLDVKDPNFDPITFVIVSPPSKGVLVLNNAATGDFTYTPNANATGSDSFTYKASDAEFTSNVGTANITITPVNDAPVANAQQVYVGVNKSLVITLSATDADGDPITYTVITQPVNGTLSGFSQPAGSNTATVTYTPKPNFVGNDSFQFTAKDTLVTSTPATISIGTTAPPVISSISISPNPALTGFPVSFSASVSYAGAAPTVVWDFGDGNTATGSDVTHTYTQSGSFLVTATATTAEGLSGAASQTLLVGVGVTGSVPPGAVVPGGFGIKIGGDGVVAKSKASLLVNYVSKAKTTFSATVGGLAFPPNLNQGTLVGQVGILTIGQGAMAQQFVFTLDRNGRGKATGLPTVQVTLKRGQLNFKATGRKELTDLVIALGAGNVVKGNGHQVLSLPMTLQVGNSLYLAMTFQLDYNQLATTGKGKLDK